MFESLLPRAVAGALRVIALAALAYSSLSLAVEIIHGPTSFEVAGIHVKFIHNDKFVKALLTSLLVLLAVWMAPYERTLKHLTNIRPAHAAALAAVAHLLLFGVYLQKQNFDITSIVHLGEQFFPGQTPAPGGVTVMKNTNGYDGQFFYRMAIDPWMSHPEEPPFLDAPAYRHQRILYPALLHVLSLGNPAAIPYMMALVNIIALAGLAWVGVIMAVKIGRPNYYGLVFPAYAGFYWSVTHALPEPLAILFLLVALIAIDRERYAVGSVALCAAVLTRETTLVAAFALMGAYVLSKVTMKNAPPPKAKPAALFFAGLAPVVLIVAWQLAIRHKWGVFPFEQQSAGNFGPPFYGLLVNVLGHLSGARVIYTSLDFYFFALYFLTAVVTARTLYSHYAPSHEQLAFAMYLGMAVFYGTEIMWYRGNYVRVFSEFYFFAALLALRTGTRAQGLLFSAWALMLIVII
jgi:hypothetical protein